MLLLQMLHGGFRQVENLDRGKTGLESLFHQTRRPDTIHRDMYVFEE